MISVTEIDFRSSSFCDSTACVEVAFFAGSGVAVRDGKRPSGGHHMFTGRAWDTFLQAVRSGKFERE